MKGQCAGHYNHCPRKYPAKTTTDSIFFCAAGAEGSNAAGAGIRVPPNALRLFERWGVDLSDTKKVVSTGNRFKDWKDNILLDVSYRRLKRDMGTTYYMVHRADLINLLVRTARERPNITIKTGARVVEYDFDGGRVRTQDGKLYGGDLVVGADGIKSIARDLINGEPAKAMDTGDVAYRILVPSKGLLDDPELAPLMTEPRITSWAGPEIHFVGYPLREGELYNMILCCSIKSTSHGKKLGEDDWIVTADNAELCKTFQGWCSPVEKLVALAGQIPFLKWKLSELPQLKRWVHPSGKVILLGDSCHPMLPYLAQGAAQATEDAGTLRAALAKYSSLPEALHAYERQRIARTAYVIANTKLHQEWLHVYDGEVRDERDRLMKLDRPENPILWGSSERLGWLFGHDAEMLLAENEEPYIPYLPAMPPQNASIYQAHL
ncbi:FAD/NAD(P)-binding domain-containing protein [Rhizodiscina lignyota]|uniref:FAD/NAD(P)-binding domain-containing protein n=1 Tax=Rhizodiscina lignyota TaxID=1504668 RepID=A0A9P4IKY9_9PEZI|nr:FAD/NAD(P)-binding domain-containing protein [Rhizodiscina lignyota]